MSELNLKCFVEDVNAGKINNLEVQASSIQIDEFVFYPKIVSTNENHEVEVFGENGFPDIVISHPDLVDYNGHILTVFYPAARSMTDDELVAFYDCMDKFEEFGGDFGRFDNYCESIGWAIMSGKIVNGCRVNEYGEIETLAERGDWVKFTVHRN